MDVIALHSLVSTPLPKNKTERKNATVKKNISSITCTISNDAEVFERFIKHKLHS